MKRICRGCKKEFSTDNKQRMYCNEKCKNFYNNALFGAKRKAKPSKEFFDWNDYRNGLIV